MSYHVKDLEGSPAPQVGDKVSCLKQIHVHGGIKACVMPNVGLTVQAPE